MTPTLLLLAADEGTHTEAEATLTADEHVKLAGYTFVKRRRDWLLGRLVAKRAVRLALGRELALSRIEIQSEENGHPIARLDGEPIGEWDLSLTHGHGHAAALFGPAAAGIDLERLRQVPEGGWRFFLTPAEREWLAEGPLGPHGEIVAWALKEAAYKAVQGRTQGLHHLTLEEVADGQARIGHAGAEGELVARYAVGAQFCLAIATPASSHGPWFDALEPSPS